MTYESPSPEQELKQNMEAYLKERFAWMDEAAEVYKGKKGVDPLDAFPEPTEVRAHAVVPKLGRKQEASVREIAGRFGIGGEADVPSRAAYRLKEGGKARKVDAESQLDEPDDDEAEVDQGPIAIIYAGSPDRQIGGDEVDYMTRKRAELKARLLKEREENDPDAPPSLLERELDNPVGATEYDMVRQVAALQDGFVPLEEPEVLPFGYDIHNNNALVHEATGHLVKIGERNGADVLHLRVDRENYWDEEEGKDKFRNRPDSAALMGIISDMLSETGDELSSVGLDTSTTYASRAVDAVRAGLLRGRTFLVGMYGRHTLARVEGKSVAEPTEFQHIPGELHEMYVKSLELKKVVDEKWPPSQE